MSLETLTDKKVASLLSCPKHVENPGARETMEAKHRKRNFRVVSDDGAHRFTIFVRQSTRIPNGFSAGLLWHAKSGEDIVLLRCNGSDHFHPNVLEGERIGYQCHIHIATERYVQAGRKAEGFAEATTTYRTLAGALHELVRRANITGLRTEPEGPETQDMFGGTP